MLRECGAKTKRNHGTPCQRLAMKNGRCHLHGGKSTGPKTTEGKLKCKMARWKHGRRSAEVILEQGVFRDLLKEGKAFLADFKQWY
jgi:hypothetical protein